MIQSSSTCAASPFRGVSAPSSSFCFYVYAHPFHPPEKEAKLSTVKPQLRLPRGKRSGGRRQRGRLVGLLDGGQPFRPYVACCYQWSSGCSDFNLCAVLVYLYTFFLCGRHSNPGSCCYTRYVNCIWWRGMYKFYDCTLEICGWETIYRVFNTREKG